MSLRDSVFETNYTKPYIQEKDLIKKEDYILHKEKYTCLICKKILLNPIMCSQCEKLFCKDCIFDYVMRENKCISNCLNFELVIPNKTYMESFQTFKVKCRSCNQSIPLMDYYQHNKKCQTNNKIVKCWNCNKEVKAESLEYPSQTHYSLVYDYNKFLSFDGEKPFLLEVSTDDMTGYATTKGEKLYIDKNINFASLFSEIQVEGKTYLKILIDDDWKFLSAGFFGISASSWDSCNWISIDKQTMDMTSTVGLFGKKRNLILRVTDKKLFFGKTSDAYHSCKVKVKYLDKK